MGRDEAEIERAQEGDEFARRPDHALRQPDAPVGDRSNERGQVAELQLLSPPERRFSYLRPREWAPLKVGQLVLAPFGERPVLGCVRALREAQDDEHITLRALIGPLSSLKPLPKDLLELLDQLADYYGAAPHEVLRLALPRFPERLGWYLWAPQRKHPVASKSALKGARTSAQGSLFAAPPSEAAQPPLGRPREPMASAGAGAGEQLRASARLEKRALESTAPESTALENRALENTALENTALENTALENRALERGAHERRASLRALLQWGPQEASRLPLSLAGKNRSALEADPLLRLEKLPAPSFEETPWLRRAPEAPSAPQLSPHRRMLYEAIGATPRASGELLAMSSKGRAIIDEFFRAGWLIASAAPPPVRPSRAPLLRPSPFTLSEEQRGAVEAISAAQGGYRAFLLHGVTGSGKTEVYLQLIEAQLRAGRSVIVLVPEIGLTPQTFRRFYERLGETVALWHSGLSPRERATCWGELSRGERRVLLGARSALFAPLPDLGLIIVDESHDSAYKQGEGVRYHARDAALFRGVAAGCPVVLGTATPSLESLLNCNKGKLKRLELRARPAGAKLPTLKLVDMSRSRSPHPRATYLSGELIDALRARLRMGEQSILLLNRRGFSHRVRCLSCGHCFYCDQCSVSLTWHQRERRLRCHYCDRSRALPPACPECGGIHFDRIGRGTEQLEYHLQELLPRARIARLDRDTASNYDTLEAEMRASQIDILLGTQMVAKGHDFPKVTLVGVIDADAALSLPDFRAAERTFQLLAQVAGRAGRAARAGEVLIQTWQPGALPLQALLHRDASSFYLSELSIREQIGYPPYQRAILFRVEGPEEGAVAEQARALGDWLLQESDRLQLGAVLRGPAVSPVAQVQGRHRWQLLFFVSRRGRLSELLINLRHHRTKLIKGTLRLTVDVDPNSLL